MICVSSKCSLQRLSILKNGHSLVLITKHTCTSKVEPPHMVVEQRADRPSLACWAHLTEVVSVELPLSTCWQKDTVQ